jgi:POT family proton-dependent oligopeptide transporter
VIDMSTNEDIEMNSTANTESKIIEWTDEVEPTDEESASLEHISDRIPLAAWLIVICELCERFAFYGLSGPFQNYIQFPEPGPNDKQPGALGRGQQTATALTTYFQFFAYLTPIGGAILADQFWGKYKTIMVACVIYMIGLLVLVLSSIPPSIHAGVAFPGLIIAMTIIGLGTGGVKSNVSPLMAEQYTRTKSVVKGMRTNFVSERFS